MAVTYTDTLLTDRDKIRFNIGDTVENSGPKPSGGNFSDNEIAGVLTSEGSVGRATARLYEALASIWARYVDSKIGPRDEKLSKVADNYRALAVQWRDDYGTSVSRVSTGFATRVDGYSDDIAGDDV